MSVFEIKENSLPKPNYEYITNGEDVGRCIEEILKYKSIEVDTETTGFDPFSKKIVLVQIGIPNKSFVFDPRCDTEHSSVHLDQLKPVLANKDILKILQNAVFDMKMLKVHAGYYLENIYDTMLVEQLFNLGISARGAGLADLVRKYLGLEMTKEPANTFQNYNQKFKPFQIEYAASDVAILTLIKDLQEPRLISEGFENVSQLEFRFTKPMCEMELNGITMDVPKWRLMLKEIEADRDMEQDVIQKLLAENHGQNVMFGAPVININSPPQLLKSLSSYGLSLDGTSEGALSKFKGVPVIDALLKYRKLNKLMSTYGESLIDQINPITGRVHTRFRQMVQTGRMSSSAPNMQNIPKNQKYRSCFIAKPGYSLITADMSGAELRILGNISEDPVFIECYANGIDLHTRTASEIFHVPMEQVKGKMRGSAKAVNFGLCISQDTEIITNSGIKKIKDANIGELIANDLGSNKIIDTKYMGTKEVFKITTRFGYSIEATEDHLMKVINKDGKYIDKKLSAIDTKVDQLCLKINSNLFNTDKYKFENFSVKRVTNYKHFELPTTLTKDWAAFLGIFIAEGCLLKVKGRSKYGVTSFGFSKSASSEFISKIDILFTKLFKTRLSRTETIEKVHYNINSVLFCEWLYSIFKFNTGLKTDTIFIPECIKISPKDVQIEFLRWLMEGDGTIKKNGNTLKIQYSSKSIKLINDLQLLFLNLGIVSSILEETRKSYAGNFYYVLDIITNKCKKVFIDTVGFVTNYKNDKYIVNSKYIESSYMLRNQNKLLNKMIKSIPNNLKSNRLYYDTLYNCINYSNNSIGNTSLEKLYQLDDFLRHMHSNDIIALDILSIKSAGLKKVYDISVDKHQYFLANGFIVHNCYGLSKYGLAARLDISEKEADTMITTYFEKYSGVKSYLDNAARNAVKKGYSTTVSGRKRFYNVPPYGHPDRKKKQRSVERAAKNAGIQGANADTIIDGFGTYFSKIPMETDALEGPCWLKGSCENDVGGKECGCSKMIFVEDKKKITKLVCSKCGADQE